MIFESMANFISKHAKLVVFIWVVLLLASAYPAIHAGEKLSYSTNDIGNSNTESMQGSAIIGEHFTSSTSSESMQILIITYTCSSEDANKIYDDYIGKDLNAYEPISSAMKVGDLGGLIQVIINYKTGYNVTKDTGNLRNCISNSLNEASKAGYDTSEVHTYVTGSPAISYDASVSSSQDIAKVDPISILLILVLIGLFFRSLVASTAPPMTIGVAFAMTLCALYFLSSIMSIFYITEILLLVSMLGAGCDYCIFILSRYREERRSGKEHNEAVHEAIVWAGESVATSGIAVMIGFGSMSLCSFGMISTMGIGLAIGIIIALFAALTLMSSILQLAGDKLFWPTGSNGEKLKHGYFKKIGDIGHNYFSKSIDFSLKHAKAIVVTTILVTVPMAYVYVTAENSYDMIGAMMGGESADGMNAMLDYVDGGTIMPSYAVMEFSEPLGTIKYPELLGGSIGVIYWSDTASTTIEHINSLSDEILNHGDKNIGNVGKIITWEDICKKSGCSSVEEVVKYVEDNPLEYGTLIIPIKQVYNVEAAQEYLFPFYPADDPVIAGIFNWAMFIPTGTMGVDDTTPGINKEICYAKIKFITKEMAMSKNSMDSLAYFKSTVHNDLDNDPMFEKVWITGTAAVMYEISESLGTEFGQIELTAVILIIILLFVVMKAYFTPLRSVLTILMSVVWTVAVTHLLFNDVLNTGVLWMVPIILLVVCLGLGMDYDILLTTRIREYHKSKGMTNDEAIREAMMHSGSVITLCGFIMGGTFGTLCLASTTMLQQFGFALMFAILVDALLIRTYVVPAAMHLMGEWNWKGPKFLNKNN